MPEPTTGLRGLEPLKTARAGVLDLASPDWARR
jgi:hypothetical protein